MYVFWLPNDPRGSWSDFVGHWELARFGRPRRVIQKTALSELSRVDKARRDAALKSLKYPPVVLSDGQLQSIAMGFCEAARKSGYTIWACAVLPQHTHLVVARHTYNVEQIATLLKGEATRQIIKDRRHPLQHIKENGRHPSMWGAGRWKVFLDSEIAIENAIRYVENNPVEEGKPKQYWPFVTPFRGLEAGWATYH
jgi:REP element-mobilizing transposase RayT